ncbi:MAG: ABC transporter permease [Armatimonadetes bacterium]|nr:ABC transporter permease [Armatimonadota bacterium]
MRQLTAELAEVWRFRALFLQLVRRDLKVRYKNSKLGFVWSIAPPLMQVACITFAFKNATTFAAKFDSYSAYVLAAMIPWTYFQTAVLDSSQSILMMYGVIRKVYMPREIIPLATSVSNFIHFAMSWLVFFAYLVFYLRAPLLPTLVWFPVLVVAQFFLVTAASLVVSCLNVFYEDVKYIVTVLFNLGLFVLPIMYLPEQVLHSPTMRHLWGGWAARIYMWNPLAVLISGYRKCMLEPPHPSVLGGNAASPFDPGSVLGILGVSFVALVLSYAFFNARKWRFVERP